MLLVAITLNMKVMEDKGKTLLIEDYLNKIKLYLINLINYLKTQGE